MNSSPFRDNGKIALGTILNIPKNVTTIEKYIFDFACSTSNNKEQIENNYNEYLYQVIGDILTGNKLKSILANIKLGKLGWKHSSFEEFDFKIKEQDNFILNPFEVVEGALQCNKCGGKRVFSYQRQCRSSDESSTTFAECVVCKSKWTYSG